MSQKIIDISYYLKGKEGCEILNKKVDEKDKGEVNIKGFFHFHYVFILIDLYHLKTFRRS